MSAKKSKYYVVWKGKTRGVFSTWEACKAQVEGYTGAAYKSYESKEDAEYAFKHGAAALEKSIKKERNHSIILDSLSVDAAWNTVTKDMEYQGVYTKTKEQIFHIGPVPNATNNIGEFLAIVHGLAFLKNEQKNIPIYTDSRTAIAWVRKKKANTSVVFTDENKKLADLISRAENWLIQNTYTNPILKWETEDWGEIPADFGRK